MPWPSPVTFKDMIKRFSFAHSTNDAAETKIMSHLLAFLHRSRAYD
jgi:hypothetical protein